MKNLNIPDRSSEDYRYTALGNYDWSKWQEVLPRENSICTISEENKDYELLDLSLEASEILSQELKDLGLILLTKEEALQKCFLSEDPAQAMPSAFEEDYFACQAASSPRSWFLWVPDEVQVPKTLLIKRAHSSQEFLYLKVGKKAHVKIVDSLDGVDSKKLEDSWTYQSYFHVEALSHAKCEYFLIQKLPSNTIFALRNYARLESHAEVRMNAYHKGGQKGQHRNHGFVLSDKAHFHCQACLELEKSQHVDFWAVSEHAGGQNTSDTCVWNILSDESTAVFNGTIVILKEAPQTEAYQSNKTLMLSERARVHTLPKLQIATDDVKCSHGATISNLDADQLFYLQSRGVNSEEAEKMLIKAFKYPLLSQIPSESLRNLYLGAEEF